MNWRYCHFTSFSRYIKIFENMFKSFSYGKVRKSRKNLIYLLTNLEIINLYNCYILLTIYFYQILKIISFINEIFTLIEQKKKVILSNQNSVLPLQKSKPLWHHKVFYWDEDLLPSLRLINTSFTMSRNWFLVYLILIRNSQTKNS